MTGRWTTVVLAFAALALPLRGFAQAVDGPVDKALAGHYYLSGVHEVGSELLLREDGRFEWMLAYGALDQMAQGTWRRDGDRVLLRADPPPEAPPLFRAQPQSGWSGEAQARFEALTAHMPAAASGHAVAVILRDPAIDLNLSGVEVVLGQGGQARMYDPHAMMALTQTNALAPSSARFWLPPQQRYFEALLDFIMVSGDLAARKPAWRIWHPFNDPGVLAVPELADALLSASDHFPVTIDLAL